MTTGYKVLIAIAVFIVLCASCFFAGAHYATLKYKVKSDDADVTHMTGVGKKEQQAQLNQNEADRTAQKAEDISERKNLATIASLRRGTLRLSSQLAAARREGGESQTAGAPGGSGLQCPTELPTDTAEFLIRESHRADVLAIHYNKAIAILRSDRQIANGDSDAQAAAGK